jgi:hypothetical protein
VPELDPLTGKDPSSLTVAQLAERLAMERALREQEHIAVREALEAVRALFDAQVLSDRRALELQAVEYERRLEALNHAHEQAVQAQAMTVPREMFDQYVKEHATSAAQREGALNDKTIASIEALNSRVNELQNWRSGVEGRIIGIAAVIGVVVIVVNLAIRLV